jgi:hypothetical protein
VSEASPNPCPELEPINRFAAGGGADGTMAR